MKLQIINQISSVEIFFFFLSLGTLAPRAFSNLLIT
jgi:hypothetical protein